MKAKTKKKPVAKAKGSVLASINARKIGRTLRAIANDLERQAKLPGKRRSKTGKTYYESRVNRSDYGRKASKRI